tara:strand:- start:18 stop:218 length:201 start_codon:yes stop_codon:yes gene_type:complete
MSPENIYANETPPRLMSHNKDCNGEHDHSHDQWHSAEETNGRFAMLGFVAALGAYVLTGDIIPGIF